MSTQSNTENNTNTALPGKPITLRVIFILNALMAILPFIFYAVITSKDISIGNLDPTWMLYTGAAYILSFVFMVRSILKRNILAIRIIIGLNVLIALPAKAYLGILVALISIVLTFHKKVKAYFMVD